MFVVLQLHLLQDTVKLLITRPYAVSLLVHLYWVKRSKLVIVFKSTIQYNPGLY